jgi:type IV secretion system protein VirB6
MFDILFNFIDTVTLNNVQVMAVRMAAVIKPLMASLVVLYAIFLAYQALFDAQNMMVMESIKFIGSLALVTTVAINVPWYLDNIVPIVINSGQDIVNALLNPPASSTAGTLQIMSNKVFAQKDALWGSIDISIYSGSSLKHAAIALIQIAQLTVSAIPFLAICTLYLVVSKIMVSFLLILGPLFIMFGFFPSTRDFFKAWTGQCFNYILLTVLFPIAFSLFGDILDEAVFSKNVQPINTLMSTILFIVLSFVAVQIPTFASSLSGGIGINGLVGSIAGAASGLSRLLKGGRPKTPKLPKVPKGDNISAG